MKALGLGAVVLVQALFCAQGAQAIECSLCCYTADIRLDVAAGFRVDVNKPVNWEALKIAGGWDRVSLGPPLARDLFPHPGLGSFSRSPITLRYWWE